MNADILFFLNEWATNTTPDKFYREKMGIFPKTFSVNNKSLANEIWAKSGNPWPTTLVEAPLQMEIYTPLPTDF